jgi:DNA primase
VTTLEEAVANGTGVERPFNCHIHQDHNASASVNVDKGVWCCYACGAKGRVDGFTIPDIEPNDLLKEVSEILATTNPYPESWLDIYDSAGPGKYWESRFTIECCKHFRLGQDPATGAPTYPLRNTSGEVLGVVKRSLLGEGPKYLYPKGADIAANLFNFSWGDIPETAILVEGAADAMALWDAGYTAWGVYGSQLRKWQGEIIQKAAPRKVVLCFDKDNAGRAGSTTAANHLAMMGIPSTVVALGTFKDIAEAPIHIRKKIMEEALTGSTRVVRF